MKQTLWLLLLVALCSCTMLEADEQKDKEKGKHALFMITASHTPEDCMKVLDDVTAKNVKLLGRFEWGCMAGDHTGYMMMEGESEASIKRMLPVSMQNAKVVKVTRFTAEQIRSFHEKK